MFERLGIELALVVDAQVVDRRARPLGQIPPRHQVGVVLELGGDDVVAGADVVAAVGVGDEVERLGGLAGEDHLAPRGRVQERGHLVAGALVGIRGDDAEVVDAAVDVRIPRLVHLDDPVDHRPRLLRRVGRVEVDQRLAVHGLGQDREVELDPGGIERGVRFHSHALSVVGVRQKGSDPVWRGQPMRDSSAAARRSRACTEPIRSSTGSKKPRTITRWAEARSSPRAIR